MKEYITLDAHKRYSFAAREEIESRKVVHTRIPHEPGCIRQFLADAEPGTTVAVEATGNWYWIVDEIEAANCRPALVHPRKAKLMLGCINKTDKLDVDGMTRLQRAGTLPTVWIAPGPIRDLRELPRTRMFLSRDRTRYKNHIQANLNKYGLAGSDYSDPFGKAARQQMRERLNQLPPQTRRVTAELLGQLEAVQKRIEAQERRITKLIKETPEMKWLQSLPGVGPILSTVIALEIGDIARFPSAEHLASYGGTTPRVHSSGDKTRFGRLRPDVNHYLKWAFLEAANCVCLHQDKYAGSHVWRIYERIARRKGYQKAVGAMARHLAEAAFYILTRKESYKEPTHTERVVLTNGNASAIAA